MKFFDVWYQKFLLRFSFMIAFLAFLGVFVYAYWTETQLINPGEKAPFQGTFGAAMEDPKAKASLADPHRTDSELKTWINTVVAETLSFDGDNFQKNLTAIRPYYTDAGFNTLKSYIKQARIIPVLRDKNSAVGVYIKQPPLLMNTQSIGGVHRWLYQIPIMISYVPRGQSNLLGASAQQTQNLVLRLQLRRVSAETNAEELQIESWQVTSR